jgi:hypothetical protein
MVCLKLALIQVRNNQVAKAEEEERQRELERLEEETLGSDDGSD